MSDDTLRPRRLIRWPVVYKKTGKSRTQAWRDIRVGRFPAPVQTGPNSVAWYEDEIDTYVESLPRVRYKPVRHEPAQVFPPTLSTKTAAGETPAAAVSLQTSEMTRCASAMYTTAAA